MIVCVDVLNAKQIDVEVGINGMAVVVLVHAQSISDVGNIWISESGRVQVVVTELGGAARARGVVSLRVMRSRNGYI